MIFRRQNRLRFLAPIILVGGFFVTWKICYHAGVTAFTELLSPIHQIIMDDLKVEGRRSIVLEDFSGLEALVKRLELSNNQSIAYIIHDSSGRVIADYNIVRLDHSFSYESAIYTTSAKASAFLIGEQTKAIDQKIGTLRIFFEHSNPLIRYWLYLSFCLSLAFCLFPCLFFAVMKLFDAKARIKSFQIELGKAHSELLTSTIQAERTASILSLTFEALATELKKPAEAIMLAQKAKDESGITNYLTSRLVTNIFSLVSINPEVALKEVNNQGTLEIHYFGILGGRRSLTLALHLSQMTLKEFDQASVEACRFVLIDLDPMVNDYSVFEPFFDRLPDSVYAIGIIPETFDETRISERLVLRLNWTLKRPFSHLEVIEVINNKPIAFELN